MIINIHENLDLNEFNDLCVKKSQTINAYKEMHQLYKPTNNFPNFRDYRTGPYVFDKIKLNWIIIIDENNNLLSHGMLCKIFWDGSVDSLPEDGWTGSTITSYKNEMEKIKNNTMVGLFAHVTKKFRDKKLSGELIESMKKLAKKYNYKLIIPLRPPSRYQKEYCSMDFEKFCNLKREDGMPVDPWFRLHRKLNAKFLKISKTSHQRAMSISTFYKLFGKKNIEKTGYYDFEIFGNWHNIYIDLSLSVVVMNEGCQWVEHNTSN